MANLMPYDELNILRQYFTAYQTANKRVDEADAEDEILDLLILAYMRGVQSASDTLGIDIVADADQMRESVYKKIADKDFVQRAREAAAKGDIADLQKIAETDAHRVYGQAIVNAAKASGRPCNKVWITMADSRVRDTHEPLDHMVVDINDDFYTWDNDHAPSPGLFEKASNNVNCRCVIEIEPK